MENLTDVTQTLKVILQLHLATDAAATRNLPYVLDAICPQVLAPSPHLAKWTARVNSLLHSKEVHARWTGLCLAHRTSIHSRSVMIENAQSWLGVSMPNLSRKEAPQILVASANLCRMIFCSATDIPEFQRQVCTPNVPKFTAAILAVFDAEESDREIKVLLLRTLGQLVLLYPNIHRASHTSLSSLCLRLLDGSVPTPTHPDVLHSASRLYAALPVTGGKVGATNLWKKSLDDTLVFGQKALSAIQNALSQSGHHPPLEQPHLWIHLNVDRLRCCTTIIDDLFGSDIQRPVQIPIGPLADFSVGLLTLATNERKMTGYGDLSTLVIASSVVSEAWKAGCSVVLSVATHARHHLTPHSQRLVSCLILHLERNDTYSQRLTYLHALEMLLVHTLPFHSDAVCNRVARAMIPLLSIILPSHLELQPTEVALQIKGKRKKKRGTGFEGDEIFKTSRDSFFSSPDDGKVVLVACRVLQLILRNPNVSPATHSISLRVILSILLFLPQRTPSSISPNVILHKLLLLQLKETATELALGTTDVMSKSLAVVLKAIGSPSESSRLTFDLLLHPRVPPLVRSMPHVESLSLFHAEESIEEARLRTSFGLSVVSPKAPVVVVQKTVTPDASAPLHSVQPVVPTPTSSPHPVVSSAPNMSLPPSKTDVEMGETHASFVAATPVQSFVPTPARPQVSLAISAPDEEDDKEEMPSIDMDSDSD